jgi:hypothetical protein
VAISRDRTTAAFVRGAAIVLAVASAGVVATTVTSDEPHRPLPAVFLRALAVTAPLQIGLFWSATARRWARLWAALLMAPSALLLAGFVGEAIEKLHRGFPLKPLPTVTWLGGAILYLWRFFALAFPRRGRAAA